MIIRKITSLKILFIIALPYFISTSCSTSRKVSTYEVKPLSASKIIRKLEKETPVYKSYESKKISIDFENNDSKNSFSGQFSIIKNNSILLTIKKLSIPLGKGLVTQDSIKLVNYIDKYYINNDINSLQKLFGIELDYNLLQALLTADISSLLENEDLDKELTSYIDSHMYRIDSEFDKRIDKALAKGKEKRLNRYMNKMDDSEFIDYNVWIDPQFFVIRKVTFNNIKNKESLTIKYDQYELVGRSLFPQQISLEQHSLHQNINLELKLSKSSVNEVKDFNFVIPEKYEKYKLQ